MGKCNFGIFCPHRKCKFDHPIPIDNGSVATRVASELYPEETAHAISCYPDAFELHMDNCVKRDSVNMDTDMKYRPWYRSRQIALHILRKNVADGKLEALLNGLYTKGVVDRNIKCLEIETQIDMEKVVGSTSTDPVAEHKNPAVYDSPGNIPPRECYICFEDLTNEAWTLRHAEKGRALYHKYGQETSCWLICNKCKEDPAKKWDDRTHCFKCNLKLKDEKFHLLHWGGVRVDTHNAESVEIRDGLRQQRERWDEARKAKEGKQPFRGANGRRSKRSKKSKRKSKRSLSFSRHQG